MTYASSRKHKPRRPKQDIIIYFDNDVHGEVEGYAKISALREKTVNTRTPYVSVISCGDFSQGSHLCSFTHGRDIMSLLNMAGYSVLTLGNHEFDYGPEHVEALTSLYNGDIVLCNFEDLRSHEMRYKPYIIQHFGKVKVAFVGVLNPSTEMTDAPQTYFDENGNKIFSFHAFDVYNLVQKAIDDAYEKGADYVIIISHLGENMGLRANSIDLIKNTHGALAVLDGHAHHVLDNQWVSNAKGDSTLILSTGSRFEYIGQLLIDTKGKLRHHLIDTKSLSDRDPQIVERIDSLERAISNTPPFGYSDFDLLGYDSYGVYDRNCETNLGDLCADATRITMGAQIAWVNAGGIRTSIKHGSFGIREVIGMYPFDNTVCISEVKGNVIRNALEYCMRWYPIDTGNFPLISGMKFTFDPSIPSAAILDENDALMGIKEGPQRVQEIYVLNEKGEYIPLDPEASYSVAGTSFLLKNGGCGGIFNDSNLLFDSGTMDTQSFEDYTTYNLEGRIPEQYREPQGRISVVNATKE